MKATRLQRAARTFHLTPRETQTLAALARGLKREAVAAAMGVSVWTVQFHVRNVLRKTGCGNCLSAFCRLVEE